LARIYVTHNPPLVLHLQYGDVIARTACGQIPSGDGRVPAIKLPFDTLGGSGYTVASRED
jgi:hypothetical protein